MSAFIWAMTEQANLGREMEGTRCVYGFDLNTDLGIRPGCELGGNTRPLVAGIHDLSLPRNLGPSLVEASGTFSLARQLRLKAMMQLLVLLPECTIPVESKVDVLCQITND